MEGNCGTGAYTVDGRGTVLVRNCIPVVASRKSTSCKYTLRCSTETDSVAWKSG